MPQASFYLKIASRTKHVITIMELHRQDQTNPNHVPHFIFIKHLPGNFFKTFQDLLYLLLII